MRVEVDAFDSLASSVKLALQGGSADSSIGSRVLLVLRSEAQWQMEGHRGAGRKLGSGGAPLRQAS